tara:strand:+ start:2074 stop:2931 length:858 start_codon:yes stop_codon:yes gene_type:complete
VSDMLWIFAQSLAPALYDKQEVSQRRGKAESALKESSLKVHHLFESGSWTHGTSVAGRSDVDYMAWAIASRPALPSSALRSAKAAVEGCDWKITSVQVDSPAVAVTYYSEPNFDIVPAWYRDEVRGFNVFWIPGRGDEWILSAPAAHVAYVNRQNDRLSKKVKPLVRLLKAWKYHVNASVSSFYMEMRTAEYVAGETSIIFAIDLRSTFRKMIAEEVRGMNDPEGIVGRIPACSSDEKRRQTLASMQTALANLERAEAAEKQGDKSSYWGAMFGVFGKDFPWPDW